MLSDLHIGQRIAAVTKLRAIITRGPSYSPEAGIRDVAESWAGMHLEPRLLLDLESRRRERVVGRATEVLAITEGVNTPSRRQALEILAALAMAESRWSDALVALETLMVDEAFSAERRSDFALAAGDILAHSLRDTAAAQRFYDRARRLWPGSSGLTGRPGA